METQAKSVSEYLDGLVKGIDISESTEWEKETRYVSEEIRKALAEQLGGIGGSACETRFLDYCNCVKSLLAVYNFGNLQSADELAAAGASPAAIEERRKLTEADKKLMKDGVRNILLHIKNRGFDITPYLAAEECLQIFGDGDSKITVPVTVSATTVMTTLVYFRRACGRKGLYSDSELIYEKAGIGMIDEQSKDLADCAAQAVAKILYLFAGFITGGDEKKKYGGWGFTLDPKQSQAVTLNDTYAVVDAISRFDDAFNQDDETKRDEEFLQKVGAYGNMLGFRGSLVNYCINSIYRTAYNIYTRDKSRLYGKSLFYVTDGKFNSEVTYTYNPITYEQIASSNRSSALFNPLYVAMITMYGYNEKESVIRRFMDDYALAKQYYDRCEPHMLENGKMSSLPAGAELSLSEYAKTLPWFKKDFEEEVRLVVEKHDPISFVHGSGEEWRRYYDIARVFQKYLEKQLPGELMKIEEYRDYLNATKDAIDQVQIAYRKFDDSQRLGIVDTDYIMFSTLDLAADPITISKLNKANISANYLRPLLLSSKIMIVNALTKYPQADMGDLYAAIKDSKHRKVVKKRGARSEDIVWLWNEDTVDMNSTARHCEAIMYDYFDYYEKYELSYKSLSNLKKYYGSLISAKTVNLADGEPDYQAFFAERNLSEFKRVVLDLTRQNVNKVKVVYAEHLRGKDKDYQKLEREKAEAEQAYEERIAEVKAKYEKKLSDEKKKHAEELKRLSVSIDIGNTVRDWIRKEADRHLSEMLSYMILNNINGLQKGDKDFRVGLMMRGENDDELADGKFGAASELSQSIMEDYKKSASAAEELYGDKFRAALDMQALFEGALDDVLKLDVIRDTARASASLGDKNATIKDIYNEWKLNRKVGMYCSGRGEEVRAEEQPEDNTEND